MHFHCPIAREGLPFILSGLLFFLFCLLTGHTLLAILFGLVSIGVAAFFRDPHRQIMLDELVVLSPADGRILEIKEAGMDEMGMPIQQISIFMSVFNCHINRVSISGEIKNCDYNPGKFLPAFREKVSELNEQNTITIAGKSIEIRIRQIAGLIARRIVCRVKPGDSVNQGDRFGLIMFGSRVDLLLPSHLDIIVRPGQKVKAGLNIIAKIKI